jgi:hypothetical protein
VRAGRLPEQPLPTDLQPVGLQHGGLDRLAAPVFALLLHGLLGTCIAPVAIEAPAGGIIAIGTIETGIETGGLPDP